MLKKFLIGTFVVAALAVFAATASAAYDFGTTTLRVGSRGPAVVNVQTVVGAVADGVFGPMTASKVMAWQSAHGLTADGVVGPATKAAMNAAPGTPVTGLPAGCTSTVGYSATTGVKCSGGTTTPGTGTIGTGEGDISNVDEVSSDDSSIKEGETSEIFAFTAEVEGDVSVDRVDFYLDSTAAASQSEDADDYFDAAVLMVDGKKVATLDVSDFDESSYAVMDVVTGDTDEYRLRFSGLNLPFKDGDEPEFVLGFEVINNIETADITETWGVELLSDSIRFVDGRGFTGTAGAALEETFTASSEDIARLSVTSSSNDPEASTIEVSNDSDTEEVEVFVFEVEERNDVDVTINDLTMTIETTGTTDESAVIRDAFLYNGSTLLDSESVPSNGSVVFENLGFDINAGDTEELTVKLTFADVDLYTEGTTVQVTLASIDDVEDANGNDNEVTISGTPISSEIHVLRSTGVSVDVKSATTTINTQDGATNDIAEFTWVFDVTAFGDEDVYINAEAANILTSGTAEVNTLYSVESSAASSLAAASLSGTMSETDSDVTLVVADDEWTNIDTDDFYKIESGSTGTFTLTVTGTNETAAKQVRALLNNIEWTTDVVTTATATALTINSYTTGLGSDAATPFKAIN